MGFGDFFKKLKEERQAKEKPAYLKERLEVETLKSKIRKQRSTNQGKGFGGMNGVSFHPNVNALFGGVPQPAAPKRVKARKHYKLVEY